MTGDTHLQYIAGGNLAAALTESVTVTGADRLFVLTDTNTSHLCLPLLQGATPIDRATEITIAAGDINKTIASLQHVWQTLSDGGATRRSLLINLGGGMVTDLGGFAAATFKRGIGFINLPTTLLSMVDASIGGKTGINFNGLKNEVGAFAEPAATLISTQWLDTLPDTEMRSGYGEMIKHALLDDATHLSAIIDAGAVPAKGDDWQDLISRSVDVKRRIVAQDRHEHGMRKALNLGHTAGHAFEEFAMAGCRPVPHGFAVAWGLVVELYMSVALEGFPTTVLRRVSKLVRETFGRFDFTCDDYECIYGYMSHDKKNTAGQINFTLLSDIGRPVTDCHADKELVFEAFDFLRDGL